MNNNEGDNFLEDYDLLNDEPYPEGDEYQDIILAAVLTNNVQIDKKPNKMTKFYKAPELEKEDIHIYFLSTIRENILYEASDLTEYYNQIVKPKKPLSTKSFGQMKIIKQFFKKEVKKKNGKLKTFYMKIIK